jgi:hypothetical protein
MKTSYALFIVLVGLTVPGAPDIPADTLKLLCEETSLGKVQPGQVQNSVMSSPDGRHVAYEVNTDGKSRIVVDGVAGKPYDHIAYFHFSSDGSRFGYAGVVNKKWIIVADGKEIGECDLTGWANPVFSLDGKRVAYSATHGHYESPNAQDSAVVDGKDGPLYGRVDRIQFSPDSKHCAYLFNKTRRADGDYGVVLDGVEQPKERMDVRFSPDGRIAWIVRRDGKLGVELDGKLIAQGYDSIDLDGSIFSPDGKRTAFWATRDKDSFVVVDGVAHKSYARRRIPMGPRNMERITFSSDGRRVAYPVEGCVVVDGKETKHYDSVLHDSVAISPEGAIAFTALAGHDSVLVVDGVSSWMGSRANRLKTSARPSLVWTASAWLSRHGAKTIQIHPVSSSTGESVPSTTGLAVTAGDPTR